MTRPRRLSTGRAEMRCRMFELLLRLAQMRMVHSARGRGRVGGQEQGRGKGSAVRSRSIEYQALAGGLLAVRPVPQRGISHPRDGRPQHLQGHWQESLQPWRQDARATHPGCRACRPAARRRPAAACPAARPPASPSKPQLSVSWRQAGPGPPATANTPPPHCSENTHREAGKRVHLL